MGLGDGECLGDGLGKGLGKGLGQGLGEGIGENEGVATDYDTGSIDNGSDFETERARQSDIYDTDEGEEGMSELYPLNDANYEVEEEDLEDSDNEGADNGK